MQMEQMVLFSKLYFQTGISFFVSIVFFLSMPGCKSPVSLVTTEPDTLIVNDKELIPEGIAVHPGTGTIYLSSLHQNKIVSLDKRGHYKDLITSGQGGFMKGLGIKISRDGKTLWACSASLDTVKSVSGLFEIDLGSGKMAQSYFHQHDSTSLFNDLVIHSSGDIYITDTYQGTIFRYQQNSKNAEPWLRSEQLTLANGIAFSDDEKILFVASGDKGVQRIDMDTKQVRPVTRGTRTDYAIDGLLYHNKALIGVIGWPQDDVQNHRILRYHLTDDYYFSTADTLLINRSYLQVPTTAALLRNRLYILGKTNLGLYNRGQQSLETVKDFLQFPLIVQVGLK
jgi:hypothetical protein